MVRFKLLKIKPTQLELGGKFSLMVAGDIFCCIVAENIFSDYKQAVANCCANFNVRSKLASFSKRIEEDKYMQCLTQANTIYVVCLPPTQSDYPSHLKQQDLLEKLRLMRCVMGNNFHQYSFFIS